MKLNINEDNIQIICSTGHDIGYIKKVLGLEKEGDKANIEVKNEGDRHHSHIVKITKK